jgi:Osmosensitive K+ channel histidine kinase
MNGERPTPESLMKIISSQEGHAKRGRLKIFFGYAAGVGKTYAMLDAAHSEQKAGVDVVLGYIEPHSRPDTMALAEGFEAIPVKKVSYRGIVLNEFDLDAALERKPELILVDELAHSNAAGCRHIKRYDDIEELLSAGIDVFTTLNVQHLESLNDIVASITHITVKERVPDFVFDRATQVELVDIEPDVLIERLNAKKIYGEKQAKRALDHFFTRDNLVALREIALRRIADKVNREVESSRNEVSSELYYAGEHILVCLSSSPSNARVIRTAARFASAFHASFTALFVETPHTRELNDKNRARLRENLKLAEQLGAKIATVYGDDVAYQIAQYAKVSGVSKIVMGRSSSKSGVLFRSPNFVERLTALAPNMDIYIIPDNLSPYRPRPEKNRIQINLNLPDLLKTIGILALCTLIGMLFYTFHFMQINIITIYILGVLIISNQTGSRIYGLGSSVISVLAYNWFFIEPRYTLGAYGADYPVTFLIMLIASLITSSLTMRVKLQARAAAVNAHRTGVLLETSRKLQRASEFEKIVEKSSQQLSKLLNQPVLFFSVKNGELQKPWIYNSDPERPLSPEYSDEEEYAVAVWVFRNRKPAGVSTDTLPGAKALYLPVKGTDAVLAVIGVPMQPGNQLEIFERSLLDGMLYEIAIAIEKYNLNEKQNRVAMNAEKERLRANFLRAISHDLRTPLTSISGNASVLLNDGSGVDPTEKRRLLENIYEDSLWLINLVENILAVTKIDDGQLNIQAQPELVQDLVAEALLHIDRHSSEHRIEVHLENEFLMVRIDAHLIVQVIINIINNAITYTPAGSLISVRAFRKEQWGCIEIADNGNGITDKDKKQIFDLFYTANNASGDSRRGLGLGLSLCKSIVAAHGGEIYVRDHKPHGTVFGFSLPLEEVNHDR